jgi:hypothetical protein
MEKTGWKILAIVLLIIVIIENLFFAWGYMIVEKEAKQTRECYYGICANYPDAYVEDGVCFCYDYDNLGQLIVAKTEIIR